MRCPNCGAKIKVKFEICTSCGTKVSDIKEASFSLVKKVRKEYQPELVVYTTVFPKDLSYKNTLLWCIFGGIFGGHLYYTQRYFKAILQTCFISLFLICMLPIAYQLKNGSAGFLSPFAGYMLETQLYLIPCVLGALAVIMWVYDLIKILTKHFEVPVVLPEKKK